MDIHTTSIPTIPGRSWRLSRALLAAAVAACAALASPVAQSAHAALPGGACNAFPGAAPLGAKYEDSSVSVPACGPRPYYGGPTPRVYAYPGAIWTSGYQCVEFSERYLYYKYGARSQTADGSTLVDAYARAYPSVFARIGNGTAGQAPQKGDVLSLSHNPSFSGDDGHTAVVTGSAVDGAGNGTIDVAEQNAGDTGGAAALRVSRWVVQPFLGMSYIKWLHHPTPAAPPKPVVRAVGISASAPGGPSGYVMDDFGGLHAAGAARDLGGEAAPRWAGWDIARDVAVRSDGSSGYLLDGFGGVHAFGGAPAAGISAYWNGWDIARRLVLRPDGASGYVLDGFGGLHPFGGAPTVYAGAYWSGWDIARDVVLRSDGRSGYTLDGFGGLHAFGGAPTVYAGAYWKGWDIARGVALRPDGQSGYTLDGYGGVHPFGGAPAVGLTAYYPGHDVARALALTRSGNGGWVAFANGQVAPFGDAPAIANPWRSQ